MRWPSVLLLSVLTSLVVSIGVRSVGPRAPTEPPPQATLFAASNGSQPTRDYTQASWGNGRSMCLDPAASTSCSGGGSITDKNDCSCTCNANGIGPCLTWGGGFVNRWLGPTPYFNLNTQVTLVSSQSNAQLVADPIAITPRLRGAPFDGGISNAAQFTFIGQTTTTTSTTISALNPKSHTSGTQLRVTLTAGQTISTLYQNTTGGKASTSWSVKSQAGGFLMAQPLNFPGVAGQTVNPSPISPEVDTWATSDTINVLAIPTANITQIRPQCDIEGAGEACVVLVQDIQDTINSPIENLGDQQIDVGPYVMLADDFFGMGVMVSGPAPIPLSMNGSSNCFFNGGLFGGFTGTSNQTGNSGSPSGTFTVLGGVVSESSNAVSQPVINGMTIDGDTDFESTTGNTTTLLEGVNYAGFVQANGVWNLAGGVLDLQRSLYDAGGGGVFWWGAGVGGTHTLDSARGFVYYPAGASAGANAFPNSFVLKTGGLSVGCAQSAAGTTSLCNQPAASGANLDSLLAADAGCVTNGGGSGFCNTPL